MYCPHDVLNNYFLIWCNNKALCFEFCHLHFVANVILFYNLGFNKVTRKEKKSLREKMADLVSLLFLHIQQWGL